jgi:hypothetical protein
MVVEFFEQGELGGNMFIRVVVYRKEERLK